MKKYNTFSCPICRQPLHNNERMYRCLKGHAFDCAKEGYVNLLTGPTSHKKEHGDNKDMIIARRNFLSENYYTALKDELACLCLLLTHDVDNPVLLDAGCAEGYYTYAILDVFAKAEKPLNIFGIDLSKQALKIAAKRSKDIKFAVSNIFNMPIFDSSVDLLIEICAPIADREFLRVLKPSGFMVLVVPGPYHLFSLKEAVYDCPYPNDEKELVFDGFSLLSTKFVKADISLQNNTDILNLFSMTPYLFHTPTQFLKRLDSIDTLDTTIEFSIFVYQKS